MTHDSTDLRPRIEALPGMERLLPALEDLPPAFLVGGAVRDLLRGASGVDLDIAVEGDARRAAGGLAARLGGEVVEHERFGTATVFAGQLVVDLATTRRERYERPGALPTVEPAPLAEDLARRDFTINAMAAGLSGEDLGRLHDPHGGLADLESGTVRILHERSFIDDPTRLLRAVRYEVRLAYTMDLETERLAREAAAAGAPRTVSGARIRDELLDLLAEPEAPEGLRRVRELRLDAALHPALELDPELAAHAVVAAAEVGADQRLAALAALVASDPDALESWVGELGLRADARDRVLRAATVAARLVTALRSSRLSPSALEALLRGEPREALALARALGAPAGPVLDYVRRLSGVRLEISGADLVAAGVPESPAIGRALEATRRRKLDGEVSGREEELRLALALARGEMP
jgi:tRNA nucleotidyltransferase (CCA-adding enzyme)